MQISDFLVKKMLFFCNFLSIIVKKGFILEIVSFELHEEFQIILSRYVQFSEHVAKICLESGILLKHAT